MEALKIVLDQKDSGEINHPKLYPLISDPKLNSKIFQNRQFNQFQIKIDPDKLEEYENCDFTLTPTTFFTVILISIYPI